MSIMAYIGEIAPTLGYGLRESSSILKVTYVAA